MTPLVGGRPGMRVQPYEPLHRFGTMVVTDSNGHMKNENLMLTPNTKMHSRPILDIHTKEIECSHGCTISNIDKSKLYYLQSRGLSKDIAEDVLVSSFLC